MKKIPNYKAHFNFGAHDVGDIEIIETDDLKAFRDKLLAYQNDPDVVTAVEIFYHGQTLGRFTIEGVVEAIKNPHELDIVLNVKKPEWA